MRFDEVLNQSPPYVDVDLYASDPPLQSAVAAQGGNGEAAELSAFGKHWGSAQMLDLAVEVDEMLGEVEQAQNLLARKAFDPQQVPLAEDEGGLLGNVH